MIGVDDLLTRLGAAIDQVLEPLLPAGASCALLDYPFHPNVGDNAIWLGQKRWLARRGVKVVYEADMFSFRPAAVQALGPEVVVLLCGGGAFGDLWPLAQLAREKVISSLIGQRIVQMPQTIHFESEEKLARARDVINAHPNVSLLCRDTRSLEVARTNFDCPAFLCPDMALALGPQEMRRQPEVDCLWLARTDKESRGQDDELPAGAVREDWLTDELSILEKEHWQAIHAVTAGDGLDPEAMTAFIRGNDAMAEARLARGLELLSRGRGIVTDRLHGHILAMLLGKPHVLIDNSYGKNRGFYETWTKDCDLVEFVEPGQKSAAAIVESLRQRLG